MPAQAQFRSSGASNFVAEPLEITPHLSEQYLEAFDNILAGPGGKASQLGEPLTPKELAKRIGKGLKDYAIKPTANAVAHTGQTIVLLWILGAIEAVRQSDHMSPIANEKVSKAKLLSEVFKHLVNSTDLFMGIAGGATLGTPAHFPIEKLANMAVDATTRPLLYRMLLGGATSLVTFTGWEGGRRLWEDSMFLLDAAEIPIAKSLKFTEMITGGGTPEQRAIFKKLMGHAWNVLRFKNPENTKTWLYNTWRLNIANGEFVTILTAMTAAGVTAGWLAPGAGHVMGLLFGFVAGLVGGAIAIMLPPQYKRPITDGIRRSRMFAGYNKLNENTRLIYTAYKRLTQKQWDYMHDYHLKQIPQFLKERQGLRNDISTALVEQIYDAANRKIRAEVVLGLIKTQRQTRIQVAMDSDEMGMTSPEDVIRTEEKSVKDLEKEYAAELDDANKRVTYYFNELLNIQRHEFATFGPLVLDRRGLSHPAYKMLDEALKNQQILHVYYRHAWAGLMPEKIMELGLDKLPQEVKDQLPATSQMLLNLFYLRGAQEELFEKKD